MTKARRLRIYLACNGRCECGAKVPMAGTVIDHRVPLFMGGADDDANMVMRCEACDRCKTSSDLKAIAKVRRIIAREDGTRKPRKALASRGFDKSRRRKMDGSVIRKDAT